LKRGGDGVDATGLGGRRAWRGEVWGGGCATKTPRHLWEGFLPDKKKNQEMGKNQSLSNNGKMFLTRDTQTPDGDTSKVGGSKRGPDT